MKNKYKFISLALFITFVCHLQAQEVDKDNSNVKDDDKDIAGLIIVPVGPACEVLTNELNKKEEPKKENVAETPKAICSNKLPEPIMTKPSIDFINNVGKIQSYTDKQVILESCKQIDEFKKTLTKTKSYQKIQIFVIL